MEFTKCFEILQNRQNTSSSIATESPSSSCPCAHESFVSSSNQSPNNETSLKIDSEQFQDRTIFELISIFQKLQEERVMVHMSSRLCLLILPLRHINNMKHHFK
jgi:hypothetical protein